MKIEVGRRYVWRGQPGILVYVGKSGSWHQFKLVGDPRRVWCEVLDEDLHFFDATR